MLQTKEERLLLIPEICYCAGLTERMRNDFKLMRAMAEITQVGPQQRCHTILKFIAEINKNEECKTILSNWGLSFEPKLVTFQGRILPQETIYYGNQQTALAGDKADWSNSAVRSPVLYTVIDFFFSSFTTY